MLLLRRFISAIFLLTQINQIKPELVGKVVEAGDAKAADNVPNPDNELVGVGGLKVATESGSNTGDQDSGGSSGPSRINCDSRRPAYVTRTYTYRYMNKRGRPKTFDENRRFYLKPTYVVQYHKLKSDDQKVHYIRRRLYRYPAPSKFRNGAKWKPAGIRKKPGRGNNPKGRRYYCDVVKDKVTSLKKFKVKYPTSFENAVDYKEWAEANGHPRTEVKKKGYYLNFDDKKTSDPVLVFEDIDTKRRESDDEFEDSGDKEPEPDKKPPKLPEVGTFDGVDVSSPDEEADEDEQKNDKGMTRASKPEENGNRDDKDTVKSEDAKSSKSGSKDKEVGTGNPVKDMAGVPVAADSVPSSPDTSSMAANASSVPSNPGSEAGSQVPDSPDTSNVTANGRSIPSNPASDKVPVSPDASNITANASSIPLNQTTDAASQVPSSPDATSMAAKARSIPANSTADQVPGSPDTSSIAANASSIPSNPASGAASQLTSTGEAKAIPGTPGIGK